MNANSVASLSFAPLGSGLRRGLESTVVEARGVVESGVGKVFGRLGVGRSQVSDRPPEHLSDAERVLRLVVLAKRRQVGSVDAAIEETAFGVWHRMLFARFLAENNLLIHPEWEVAVSLAECEELAADEGVDGWTLACRYAAGMLPGLFPQDDPLAQIELLPEDLHALEELIEGLASEVFTSDDGLGWVYQFWQSEAKDAVNASEVKIGARELPAVTQLFTEHYMVRFLLENSLGAWWAARHPDSPLHEAFDYLRFTEDGEPAAGSFEGWPATTAEVTVMDPCCGSGHFLTAAFEMLWRMRAEEEHLTLVEAQDAVIRDNLFGLELDPRCTQIAAFNLALTAWKAGGYRELPLPNIACSGIRVAGSLDEWLKLAGDDPKLHAGLEAIHSQFKDADTLGSLINPRRATDNGTLTSIDFDELEPLLNQALTKETAFDPAAAVFGQQAEAIAKAATLLTRHYTLVCTNPPFLLRGKQDPKMSQFCTATYGLGAADLATSFLLRGLAMSSFGGSCVMVNPQNWLFLVSFEPLRVHIMRSVTPVCLAWLGEHAFESPAAAGAFVALVALSNCVPTEDDEFMAINAGADTYPPDKDLALRRLPVRKITISSQLTNPDTRILSEPLLDLPLLDSYATAHKGLGTGDDPRYRRCYWEVIDASIWTRLLSAPVPGQLFGGRQFVFRWEGGTGELSRSDGFDLRGTAYWGLAGVAVGLMRSIRADMYTGEAWDQNVSILIPNEGELLRPIWAFASSSDYELALRRVDLKLNLTTSSLTKVPFDLEYWREVAEREFPGGLPEPWSDDPTQWLFLGDPAGSTDPLQVAVARLMGYSWPDQEPDHLDALADEDGIVCLPAVSGERPAADRLRELVVTAFEPDDPTGLIDGLLAEADSEGKSLDWWLRERFFKQHCQLFHNRPFIWHIWDGHKDGFSALVNYHQLGNANLKKLTYSYLGWWIERQKGHVREEKAGAEARLAAALDLQHKLELILEGEPPFDVFVRWKELWEQPIGWEPDLNDGVRLNIRPFVNAEILRWKRPSGIDWGTDRGGTKDGTAPRDNGLHRTRAQKQSAREAVEGPSK